MRIISFWKHGQYITAYYKGGRQERIKVSAFEAYVNDRRSNEEEQPITEDYYAEPKTALADVQKFLDIMKKKVIAEYSKKMTEAFAN